MRIKGARILVLGGAGLVGMAVCRLLLAECPARIVVAARRKERARNAIEQLRAAIPKSDIELTSAWGDVFLRTEWQGVEDVSRAMILGSEPSFDRGEVTEKGSLNQRAMRANHASDIVEMYSGSDRVLLV